MQRLSVSAISHSAQLLCLVHAGMLLFSANNLHWLCPPLTTLSGKQGRMQR